MSGHFTRGLAYFNQNIVFSTENHITNYVTLKLNNGSENLENNYFLPFFDPNPFKIGL